MSFNVRFIVASIVTFVAAVVMLIVVVANTGLGFNPFLWFAQSPFFGIGYVGVLALVGFAAWWFLDKHRS